MCCDAPAAPNYQPVADANEAAARYAYNAANEDLAFRKSVYEDSKPRQEGLYQLALKVAAQQMGIADETTARAKQQWGEYDRTYLPVERKMVDEAMNYDSPERRERLRGEAMADVAAGSDAAQAASRRTMMRYGVNPGSGRFADTERVSRLIDSANVAGAGNAAVRALQDRGIALRAGAASFGRNMPNTAGQSFGLSTQAGSSAVANTNAGFMAGLPYAQFQSGAYGTGLGAAGLAQQGALGMGNIMSRDYATSANIYGGEMAALGTALGLGAGLYMSGGRK